MLVNRDIASADGTAYRIAIQRRDEDGESRLPGIDLYSELYGLTVIHSSGACEPCMITCDDQESKISRFQFQIPIVILIG